MRLWSPRVSKSKRKMSPAGLLAKHPPELSGLSINQDPYLDDTPPPAPKITSEGVVSINITDKFVAATKSMWSLLILIFSPMIYD